MVGLSFNDRMRETVATRRFETLCDSVLNIAPPKRIRKSKNKGSEEDEFDIKKKLPDFDAPSPPKRRKRSKPLNHDVFANDVSSGGDTDVVIERVIQKLGREKKKAHRLLYSTSPEDTLRSKPSAEFFQSRFYKKLRLEQKRASAGLFQPLPPPPNLKEGLDLENDADIFKVLDLASLEAQRLIKEMENILGINK